MEIRAALEQSFDKDQSIKVEPVKTEEPVKSAEPVKTDAVVESKEPVKTDEAVGVAEPTKIEESVSTVKAPGSWKPAVREKFAALPKEVQEEVLRREADINRGLVQATNARHFHEQFQKVTAPYETLFRAEGVDALTAVDSVLQSAALLRVGSAAQKAQLVSNLIKQFSIDIPMLDNLLSGQKVDPEEDKLSRMLDARLKPVTQFLSEIQGAKQQRTESLTASAQETLAEFTQKAEFLADVKEDVADRLEMAARRGQVMTLQEAYDWACKAHPEISKVIASRASLRTPGATPDAASASVAGSPNVGATAVDPKNLRAVIEKSWG